MPSCFKLFKKTDGQAQSLNKLDEEICTLLGVPVHPKKYGGHIYNWFDTVGFQIATGKDLGSQELRDHYLSPMWIEDTWIIKVIDYLEDNYTSHSFYQPKHVD